MDEYIARAEADGRQALLVRSDGSSEELPFASPEGEVLSSGDVFVAMGTSPRGNIAIAVDVPSGTATSTPVPRGSKIALVGNEMVILATSDDLTLERVLKVQIEQ